MLASSNTTDLKLTT